MPAAPTSMQPARVFVPHGKKPPRGVLWANCEHLDDAQLDEIVTWVNLYRSSR